jgi:hypothetical protein
LVSLLSVSESESLGGGLVVDDPVGVGEPASLLGGQEPRRLDDAPIEAGQLGNVATDVSAVG